MSTNAIRDLASIIVPCWNQVEFTQQCLSALRRHTREPWELIVIDNGSTDTTATYLAGVRDMTTVPVTVVTNAKNVGFPAAINQGLQIARGEYLVMLNNDVVVTDGWLDQLIALVNAKRGPDADRTGASGNASADAGGRPSVGTGAGSGDPRTALSAPRVGGDGGGAAEADAGTSGNAEADGGRRPSVDTGAGSGDPRTAGAVRPSVDTGAAS